MGDLTIRLGEPSDADLELVEAATALIRERRVAGRTTVAAAVRGGSGAIHTSVDCPSRMSAVCAEPGAVAAAWLAGEERIDAVVACCWTPALDDVVVISPCGACRERLWVHAPDGHVLVRDAGGALSSVPVRDLFPFAELFPGAG